jgi:1,6-anhydro-N-acetylmuramate kinase
MTDNSMAKEFVVLGMMSGTSLDGLDLSVSKFTHDEASGSWVGVLQSYCSIPIPASWQNKIRMLPSSSAAEWHQAGLDWSLWCSECVQGAVDIESIGFGRFLWSNGFSSTPIGLDRAIGTWRSFVCRAGLPRSGGL